MNNSFNIPDFDAWYDGGMSIAKNIVKIYNNSKNFTINVYEGQEDFYEEYLTKYDGLISVYSGNAQDKNINIDNNLTVLDNINQALNILRKSKMLNYGHFLGAYLQVLIYNDELKQIRVSESFLSIIGRDNINISTTVNEIVDILIRLSIKHPRVIPFTSRTGAFGMNTFLYLYFNKIYPVATSIDPYPVHNGIFPGSISTLGHDFTHLPTLRKLDGTALEDDGIRYILGLKNYVYTDSMKKYYNSIKNIYYEIFKNKNNLGSDTIKILITLLFIYLHERDESIACPNMEITVSTYDEIPVLLRNKTYTPERYGIDSNLILDFIFNDNKDGIIPSFDYKHHVLVEAHNIICNNFGYLL